MPPIQKSISYVGLARQASGKGTPATTALVGVGTLGGSTFMAPVDQDYDPQTLAGGASDRFPAASVRTAIHPGASFQTRVYPKTAGLLMYGALGANVLAGAGPFTNTATPAQTIPYFTVFGRMGSEHARATDAVIDTLSIEWDETNPASMSAVFKAAGAPLLTQAAPTYTNDESIATFLGPVGGTFQFDTDGITLATARLTGFTCEISNHVEDVMLSAAITPDDVFQAQQTIEGTIKVKPVDLADWHSVLTGSAAGTTLSNVPVYGSFSVKLTLDASNSLTLSSNRANMLTDFPEGDPSGGAVELEFAYSITRPIDGSAAFTSVAQTVATITL